MTRGQIRMHLVNVDKRVAPGAIVIVENKRGLSLFLVALT